MKQIQTFIKKVKCLFGGHEFLDAVWFDGKFIGRKCPDCGRWGK